MDINVIFAVWYIVGLVSQYWVIIISNDSSQVTVRDAAIIMVTAFFGPIIALLRFFVFLIEISGKLIIYDRK